MGGEDYFSWCEMMERCQQENDRHIQSLLRQTKRLKQENEELRAQMLALGLSQSWHPQSQQTALRQTDETSFSRNTEFSSSSYMTRSEEELSLAHQTQLDEGIDFTQTSMKKRQDKRSNLSDTLRARLGSQAPSVEEQPCILKTLKTRLGLPAAVVMSG
ncbi:hypothetical protein CK203_039518 [Vitis vinifera]|uniref:Uncharacterized protein n=2 Tax=Vitis vinifera TaxID=29760 RepID=A5C418_VITVI|nr:hypothetical protein CK203_039518 [Vitis vinifera]CAN68611.1 hypothetical protein VITISV_021130 [Vitis vinifera]